MQLTRLRLVNFRNHRRTEFVPGPDLTVLIGSNAQGKSTLLEAVQVAASGRSFRTQHDADLICFGQDFARVVVAGRRGERDVEVDVVVRRDGPDPARVDKELRVNGVPVRRGDIFGQVLCVAVTPDDGAMAAGGPLHRRRVLDLLLVQISPAYYYSAQRYARAVLQRNRLLRERRTDRELDVWDEQVARLGAVITVRRREVVARLATAAQAVYGGLSGGRETLAVTYGAAMGGGDEGEIVAEGRAALRRLRAAELARGMTLVGPHRDDLHLMVDGQPLRQFGSRGQQLAAVVALRLAERQVIRNEAGHEPVVLFDDVLLALDPARQARVLESVRGAQVVMTATGLSALPELPASAAVFRVVEGTVEAQVAHRA